MIRWNPLLRRNVAEYSVLQVVVAAHSIVSFFLPSDEFFLHKVATEGKFFNKLLRELASVVGFQREDPFMVFPFFVYSENLVLVRDPGNARSHGNNPQGRC